MCMKIDELLKKKMEQYYQERKIKQLALNVGIPQGTLSRFARGLNDLTLDRAVLVLNYLGIEAADPGIDTEIYAMIPKVEAKAGAGFSLETGERVEAYFAFRRDWLSRRGIPADKAVLIDVKGDSMEPLLRAGDTLLVDTSDTEIMDEKIYVITLQDELKVKRILKEARGIYLHSENRKYDDDCITMEDVHTLLRVHGRVRWVGKEL